MAGLVDNITFESPTYSTGNVSGQDGWTTGAGAISVVNTQAADGSQSISGSTASSNYIKRNLTAFNDDNTIMYISCRTDDMSVAGGMTFYTWGNGDGGDRVMDLEVSVLSGGSWGLREENGTRHAQGSGLLSNTWYRFGLEYDFTNNRVRANVDGGAMGSWVSMTNARSQVNHIWVQSGTTVSTNTWFWDEISATESFGGASNIGSIYGVSKANIKSILGETLA